MKINGLRTVYIKVKFPILFIGTGIMLPEKITFLQYKISVIQ